MALDATERQVLKTLQERHVPPTPVQLAKMFEGRFSAPQLSVALQRLIDEGRVVVAADWKLRTTA
jgi:hypothetical protein